MNKGFWTLVSSTKQDDESGIYELIKKLSETYSSQLPTTIATNGMLNLCYEILLKRQQIPKGLPEDWDDEDISNAIKLDICKRCKYKNIWTDKLSKKVITNFDVLFNYKNTEFFKECIGPALRFLLCVEYYQNEVPLRKKEPDKFFDTNVISAYFDQIKNNLPKKKLQFFSVPKFTHSLQLTHSQSEGNLHSYKLSANTFFSQSFHHIFRLPERSPNELDEGFVTPNEEHLEKSPCYEKTSSIHHKKSSVITSEFNWDYSVICVPPSQHKNWESFGLIGKIPQEPPFIHKDVLLQNWLSSAPPGATLISREQFIDCLHVLLIGIPSSAFVRQGDTFCLRRNLYTDDLPPGTMFSMSQKFIEAAVAFKALDNLSKNYADDDIITSAFKLALKEYLYKYQEFINKAPKKESYAQFVNFVDPIIGQITYLKQHLIHDVPLKGVSLLKDLFDLIGRTSNQQIFYILSSLFLLPCVRYFRLIDDWIFLGSWHKDLPFTQTDMTLVKDRQDWVAAYKPITTNVPWFTPATELAHCGKGISLLSISKDNEKLLNLMKSDNRPKLKICLDPEELENLKDECEKYYEEGKKSFRVYETTHEENLVQSSINAAQLQTELFENAKREAWQKVIKKKKEELFIREEDLIRSAHVRAMRKEEDTAVDRRVATEREDILLKEQQVEVEKAKLILERYKVINEEEQKILRKNEWLIKRCSLDEKRKQFLLSNIDLIPQSNLSILKTIDKIQENETCLNQENNEEGNAAASSSLEKDKKENSDNVYGVYNNVPVDGSTSVKRIIENETEQNTDRLEDNKDILQKLENANINRKLRNEDVCFQNEPNMEFERVVELSDLEKNRIKMLGSDVGGSILVKRIIKNDKEQNTDILQDNKDKCDMELERVVELTDLEKNRIKILGSDVGGSILVKRIIKNDTEQNTDLLQDNKDKCDMELERVVELTDLEKNRIKILGSDIGGSILVKRIIKNDTEQNTDLLQDNKDNLEELENENKSSKLVSEDIGFKNELDMELERVVELTDLEKNRIKILGSDLGRGEEIRTHIWTDQLEKNKRNMMQSHFYLGNFIKKKEKAGYLVQEENPCTVQAIRKETLNISADQMSYQSDRSNSNLTRIKSTCDTEHSLISEESNKLAFDTRHCEDNTYKDEHSVISELFISGRNRLKDDPRAKRIHEIFNSKNPILIPKKDFDFAFLYNIVDQSLKTVLNVQMKLVNEALLQMFLKEFEVPNIAQKLREYFFLHGDFGKRLTSLLSVAIEEEEPSTLLTFYRLRSILAEASMGDIEKMSFVVKETPVAFVHTNSQVLSCLGLTYKFDWPLNIIFTDIAISKYNDIFEYMFSLQRVSWHLEQVWHVFNSKTVQGKGQQYSQVQLYRFVMSQFVCTLRSYIVTTVIEGCWQDFIKDLSRLNDLEELYRKHVKYIKDIISKCFLDERSKKLMNLIQKLLHYVLVFCRILKYGGWNVSESEVYTHSNFDKLRNTYLSFLVLARRITKYVGKLVKVNYQKDLESLYCFLTINSFFVSE